MFNIPALLETWKTSLSLLPERLHSFYTVKLVTELNSVITLLALPELWQGTPVGQLGV